MTPEEAKRRLALGLKEEGEELDEGIWGVLVQRRLVGEAQQGEITIEKLADKYFEYRDVLGSVGQRRRQQEARELPPDDRLEVLSDLLSGRAAQEPDVLAFRSSRLRRGLLAWEDMAAWIKTQREEDGPHTSYLSVAIPDGYQLRQDKSGLIVTDPPMTVGKEAAGWGVDVRLLEYGIPDDPWTRRVPTRVQGVLDELRTLSESLAKKYGWQPSQATVFVLTGLSVQLSKGRITISHTSPYRMTGRLTLQLDPTTAPSEVLRLYRESRAELLGRRYRPLTRKHLELARFHEGRREAPWRELMDDWNRAQAADRHYRDWRIFRRDCVHAWERLLGEVGGGPGAFSQRRARQ